MALGLRTRVKAPTNFTATAASDTAITIAWTAVPTAFRLGYYTLERSSNGGSSYSNLYTGTAVSYVDTGLVANTAYLYRLTFTDANSHASPSIGAGATTKDTPNSGPAQKFIAGWYAGINQTQAGTRPGDSFSGVPNAGTVGVPNSGVRAVAGPISNKIAGCQLRIPLRMLNPTGTTYDLSSIATALGQLATFPIDVNNPNPLLLFIRLETRTFNGNITADWNPLPADIASKSEIYTGGLQNGIQAWRWSPVYLARLDTIVQKIGQQFDTHPNFGGLGTQETSTGGTSGGTATVYSATAADGTVYTGYDNYDPNNAVEGWKQESNIFKKWLPHCRGYHYMNFVSGAVQNNPPAGEKTEDGYLEDYCSTIVRNGGICGFPDLVPNGSPFTRTYPTITKVHNGTLPGVQALPADQRRGVTMGAIQPAEWKNETPAATAMTLQQRFDLATSAAGTTYGTGSPLNLDNIALEYQTSIQGAGTQKWNPDGAAIIAANPSFGNYAPPVPTTNFLYVDLNASTNGSGASSAVPTNVLPTQITTDNTTVLFNADNGTQTVPTRTDTLYLQANNLTVGSYGTGKAVLAALDTFTSGWTQVSGTVYKRTYTAVGGFVGAAINMSDLTGSAQGTVLKWTDMSAFASFVPANLASGFYAYDWSGGIMYVNVGANPNTKTIGIARNGRFISVQAGGAPSTVTIQNLRLIGFSRAVVNFSRASSAWHATRLETYAIGGYFLPSASAPPGNYEGSVFNVTNGAHSIEVDNCLCEQTFKSVFNVNPTATVGEVISALHFHHNTARYWSLAALGFVAPTGANAMSNVEFNHNIATGGGQGFAGVGDAPTGITDGVQLRGAACSVAALNVHDNTLQAFDANIGMRGGVTPGGMLLSNNRLSNAKYNIRNLAATIVINATGNNLCAPLTVQMNDVNLTAAQNAAGNGGTYSGNTLSGAQCYTPDLPTQGVQ